MDKINAKYRTNAEAIDELEQDICSKQNHKD